MSRVSLNGIWQYRIGDGAFAPKKVPYSDPCVGLSECVLTFDRHESSERAFLVFEGITYRAEVILNGQVVGADLAPYIPHRLEITEQLQDHNNHLCVRIRDLDMPFGPSCGWQNYGGIIRDVFIDYKNSSVISDIVWHYELSDGYGSAVCHVEPQIDGKDETATFFTVLKDSAGTPVGSGSCRKGGSVTFTVEQPQLWSPEEPVLYVLESWLSRDGAILDTDMQKVGFKDLQIEGRHFTLNGKPFFILGVNRHDQFGDCGHTLTEEQMYQDMRMIKAAGCNYVRLVHYPHNRRIVEIADEIGLLVSGEPGLWWSDMHNQDTCDGALEVLEGVIRRDRNRTSIAYWLSFNECVFTLDFLKDSARVARQTDPYHMVSGANCMSLEMTKENFTKCGFDFYTMHPYAPTPARILESAEYLTEMPLIFTEWGGYFTQNNERNLRSFIQTIVQLHQNPEDRPCLAGAVYWEWADMNEFHRGNPACEGGVLNEGLVDKYRNPTKDLQIFVEEFSKLDQRKPKYYDCRIVPFAPRTGEFLPVALPAAENGTGWAEELENAKFSVDNHLVRTKPPKMTAGPKLDEAVEQLGGMPVQLSGYPQLLKEELTVPVGQAGTKLHIFGNTSLLKGYPISGGYGEPVAEYIVEYADGSLESHLMKNGTDITTATMLFASSRINPVASQSPRVLEVVHDVDWEQYVMNLKSLQVDPEKVISAVRFRPLDPTYQLLLYGVTLER